MAAKTDTNPEPIEIDDPEGAELDARALGEYMTVLEDGDVRARSAPGLYTVTTQSGSQYLVDADLPACECPDFEYRNRTCKHIRRVQFATGRRSIPEWAQDRHVDDQLGIHVDDVDQDDADDIDRGEGIETDGGLPDGWERIDEPGTPYVKLVKRDAVAVPKRSSGEPFQRDAVVVVTDEIAGVTKGPGARQSWRVRDPEQVGVQLATVIDEWIREDGDPYGGPDLDDRLETVATGEATEQAALLEADR